MSVTALIDADVLLHRAASAAIKEFEWEPGEFTTRASLKDAIGAFEVQVEEIEEAVGFSNAIFALSDPTSVYFRHALWPDYKGSRVNKRKPLGFKALRGWLTDTRRCLWKKGLEGDDVLGILATHPTMIEGNKIVVSIDKDLRTVPCRLFDGKEEYPVTEREANYNHMMQTLTGDSTDCYPGLPGAGPKKAEKILGYTAKDNWWWFMVRAFEERGLTEEDALIQARLARILRAEDYDLTKKRVKLWEPPK